MTRKKPKGKVIAQGKRNKESKAGQAAMNWYAQKELIQKKKNYIQNLASANYFRERCNMMADQLNNKKILETIDGAPKTEMMMIAEYQKTKVAAIELARQTWFERQDLKKSGMTEEDIEKLEQDYFEGKIIRESYDEEYRRRKPKAEFVNEESE